jgi:hypothetical protein
MLFKGRWRFADEIGRIPCGERGVTIRVGRKWVRFIELATGRTCRVARAQFERTKDARLIRRSAPPVKRKRRGEVRRRAA